SMRDDALRAMAALDASDLASAHSICLVDDGWHQGVVGIVASRLKERYNRPTMVLAPGDEGELKGSGRSIGGFHLRDALDTVAKRQPDLLRRFGGHAMAAGVTIARADFARFKAAFDTVAREKLSDIDLARTLESDGELDAGELSLQLAEAIEGDVWGHAFAPPRFDGAFDVVEQRIVGGAHLRLRLKRAGSLYEAILFGHADALPPRIRIAYRPDVNRYQGQCALQLVVEHWEPVAPAQLQHEPSPQAAGRAAGQ
ncbi:MAG: DHHA1 domain-containing protein, partial [Casimicrobiaceae bacterium]